MAGRLGSFAKVRLFSADTQKPPDKGDRNGENTHPFPGTGKYGRAAAVPVIRRQAGCPYSGAARNPGGKHTDSGIATARHMRRELPAKVAIPRK